MSTFLVPICDNTEVYIMSVSARTLNDATTKFIDKMAEVYNLDYYCNLEELEAACNAIGITFGNFYDVEEF